MKREDAEGFLNKGWKELAEFKADYWATVADREGSESLLWAAEQLRIQMKSRWPNWPTDQERAEDFAHHVRLTASLARVRPSRH